jgi:RimJ/RimL family protein N-acetyltransferase
MYAIRPVEEKDLERIIGFFAEEKDLRYSFPEAPYPLPAEFLKQSIDSRSDSSVVVQNNAPVAFANLFNIVPGEECTIGNVIVDKKHRRKGAAQFLIHAMIDIAVERHQVGRVIVPCWSENTAGLMLYTRLGFRPFDTVVRQFSTAGSVPVQLLEKCLDSCLDEPSPVGTI